MAAQIYKLSPVDMCELAKNSVLQSGYEHQIKQQWLGPNYHLPGNTDKSNVPKRREEFRYDTAAPGAKDVSLRRAACLI